MPAFDANRFQDSGVEVVSVELSGRVCIVTGSAQGIGEATVACMSAYGARVIGLDKDAERGEVAASACNGDVGFLAVDVTDGTAVQTAVETVMRRYDTIDVLVNNAGIAAYFDAAEMTDEDWDRVFAVDLKAAWRLCRAVLPAMRHAGRGSIVNISSVHARQTAEGAFPYAAAKAGVLGLTKSLALDEGPRGIRVNAVCPGYTRTQLVQQYFEMQPNPAEAERAVVAAHPLRRIVSPQEVARVVAFLASDLSSGMTGAEVFVDAGLTARFA